MTTFLGIIILVLVGGSLYTFFTNEKTKTLAGTLLFLSILAYCYNEIAGAVVTGLSILLAIYFYLKE